MRRSSPDCLRFFNVYGPRQDPPSEYSGVISRFMDAAARGSPVTIYGDGGQTRDFVYVGDIVGRRRSPSRDGPGGRR